MTHPSKRNPGFTLIELLVVIGIIAILAAILVPTVTTALLKAKRVETKSVCTSLVAAIQQYYNDYGKLPVPAADHGVADKFYQDSDSQGIIIILTATDAAPNTGHVLNPRKKVYFDVKNATTDGGLLDPWGQQYMIKMDTGYSGKLEYYTSNQEVITSIAIVISKGPDEQQGDPADAGEDDIVSYEVKKS